MTDILMVFLQDQWYVPDTDAPSNFDTSIIGDLFDADVGWPVTTDGDSVQFKHSDLRDEEVLQTSIHYPTGTCYDERYVVSEPESFSTQVELATGEQVDIGDYDVVCISHFWMHHYYLRYLLDECPNVSFIGIQEEAVQDLAQTSSTMQAAHFDTVEKLDGYIAFNEQFREWIAPHRPNVIQMSLPVPKNQFPHEPLPREDRRDAACLGIATWNVDLANFYSNVRVLDRVRKNGTPHTGEIIGIRDRQRPDTDGLEERFDFLSVDGFIEEGMYERIADFDFAVILSMRATAGRAAADLAGMGVPCIGNIHNDFQARCFPDLSVEPHDVPKAIALAERLQTDEAFYQDVVARARREIEDCQNHDYFRDRLERYVDSVATSSAPS
ncbi:hypothetical protein Z052_00110 [Halorubrum sp. C191]|uniref:hypothetical protein n=1 Tax=Halorubrum sp. C191 TaxID=1383842 RepID=UPI000C0735C4|nr:hypothetical protein [Halorubrum sp. C191]PHQ44164.1 hypothetical protein Z052_00110 [Halorubrum sp. C191]